MKLIKLFISLVLIFCALELYNCKIQKSVKNPLNSISFSDDFRAVEDSIMVFCSFGEKLLWKNGINFDFGPTFKDELFLNNEMIGLSKDLLNHPEKLQQINEFQRLTISEVNRFITLFKFLNKNHIKYAGKSREGVYYFNYRNDNRTDFDTYRSILFMGYGNKDTIKYLKWVKILERKGKLLLTSPKDANIEEYYGSSE